MLKKWKIEKENDNTTSNIHYKQKLRHFFYEEEDEIILCELVTTVVSAFVDGCFCKADGLFRSEAGDFFGCSAEALGIFSTVTGDLVLGTCSLVCFNIFPQSFWWDSQSLCWQNEPQYRAMLHPLHVSFAFLPQFRQL